jgi:hypothetical protein
LQWRRIGVLDKALQILETQCISASPSDSPVAGMNMCA